VIGTATLVGGALAIPSFVKLGDQATLTTVAPSQPAAMEQETQATARPWPGLAGIPAAADASPEIADEPASQSAPPEKPLATASPARDASGDVAGNRSVDPPSIRKVEVFYATDRHLYKATDLHLWITTLVPAGLAVLISSLTIAGAVFGRRRWWWGGAALISLCVSFLVCGQAVIKSSTLTRLAKEDSAWFSSRRKPMTKDYPLNLGTSQVSIPPVHRPGQIESPSVWLLEFREDEGRHLMIQRIEALDATSFYSKLDQRIARDDQASAMIYIHGFNVAFDEALRRTAQLSVDIGFSGAPILYSWPSRGQLTWYRSDQDDADWSCSSGTFPGRYPPTNRSQETAPDRSLDGESNAGRRVGTSGATLSPTATDDQPDRHGGSRSRLGGIRCSLRRRGGTLRRTYHHLYLLDRSRLDRFGESERAETPWLGECHPLGHR
jgi:hypothetical protein